MEVYAGAVSVIIILKHPKGCINLFDLDETLVKSLPSFISRIVWHFYVRSHRFIQYGIDYALTLRKFFPHLVFRPKGEYGILTIRSDRNLVRAVREILSYGFEPAVIVFRRRRIGIEEYYANVMKDIVKLNICVRRFIISA